MTAAIFRESQLMFLEMSVSTEVIIQKPTRSILISRKQEDNSNLLYFFQWS